MATKDITYLALEKLIVYYGKGDVTDAQLDVYLDTLAPYDFNYIWDACQEHIRRSQWFPKVNELIALIKWAEEQANYNPANTERKKRMSALEQRRMNQNVDWSQLAHEYDDVCADGWAAVCRRKLNINYDPDRYVKGKYADHVDH